MPDRPLRVLLMIASMDAGGSEQQTLLLLKHLDRTRFEPELYLLRRCGGLLRQLPDDVPVHSFEDAPQRSCPYPPISAGEHQVAPPRWRRWWSRLGNWCSRIHWPGKVHRAQVADVARLLAQRHIDVIYDRTFHMTLIAGAAADQAGVPRVSTIVSPPSRAVPLNAGRFLAAKRRRLRAAYASAAAVVAVSLPTARDAAQYYALPRRRFIVIPNPVDAQALDATVAAAPKPPRDGRWTIACVGRISAEKGQRTLLNAVYKLRRNHPDFPLPCVWMIGDGPLRESLQRAAVRMGLQEYVLFLGHIDQPAAWIAAADALCLPSHFEGFPNVMLEAMALGVPVIARRIDATAWLGRIARNPEIRGRDYLALFDQPRRGIGIDLAQRLRRTRLNTTATRSRVSSARRLSRESHSVAQLVPRIEQLLVKAVLDSWQMSAES